MVIIMRYIDDREERRRAQSSIEWKEKQGRRSFAIISVILLDQRFGN